MLHFVTSSSLLDIVNSQWFYTMWDAFYILEWRIITLKTAVQWESYYPNIPKFLLSDTEPVVDGDRFFVKISPQEKWTRLFNL